MKLKQIIIALGIIIAIATISAVFYSEPFTNNIDLNDYNLTGANKISASILEGTNLYVTNIYGNPSWCYQETANVSTVCGGASTGLYTNSSSLNWTNIENVYDGNWSSSTYYNGSSGSFGYIYINYTKPAGALNESLWLIKREVAINNYSIDSNCWSHSTALVFRGVVQNLSTNLTINYWQCYNGSKYLNVTAQQSGSILYEEAMNWKLSGNTNMNWSSLQSYPAACPGSSAITQLGDSVTCSDLWVDVAGDNMTGNLNVTGNVTASNVHLPAKIYAHSNRTNTVVSAGVFANVSFDEHEAVIQERMTHTWNDATNDTITIIDSGDYTIHYSVTVIEPSATPTTDFTVRAIQNNVEINGSARDMDLHIQNSDRAISHFFTVSLLAGDEIKLQFTGSTTTVGLGYDATYASHPTTATINIERKV